MAGWKALSAFRDPAIPKLNNLRRATDAGVRVPMTFWIHAAEFSRQQIWSAPAVLERAPCILRSGSPTEDTKETSNAGQLLSLVVRTPADFTDALAAVVAALPVENGRPLGTVFLQPLVEAEEAGVAFFDGFYYEKSFAAGSNEDVTSGHARGEVQRGHLNRGDPWSSWLDTVFAVFPDDERIDIEFARDEAGYILLQSRPALFEVAKNRTVSLANHKEILGDPPSPWIASVLNEAGSRVLDFFRNLDPRLRNWDEDYAVPHAERSWMNFSFFFRLMDLWGLPRAFVVEGAGGRLGHPDDKKVLWPNFFRSIPSLIRLQLNNVAVVRHIDQRLAELDQKIDGAKTVPALFAANVAAMELAITTNFAINGIWTGVHRIRTTLGIESSTRVVTQDMMEGYDRLRFVADPVRRREEFDQWLSQFGHRGPLESDPAKPRFGELSDRLWHDLGEGDAEGGPPAQNLPPSVLLQPLYWIDRRREQFRDESMMRWKQLRAQMITCEAQLIAEGSLDVAGDVFYLTAEDVSEHDLKQRVASRRQKVVAAEKLVLPDTASEAELVALVNATSRAEAIADGRRVFEGIPLSSQTVTGKVVRAAALMDVLGDSRIGADTILVVKALEPSWALVFPRVRGVVAELGGELSHASILLREASKPAIVNCNGVWLGLKDGDQVELDGQRGTVERVDTVDDLAP